MLAPEDENDAEVRREDQVNINRFARLNARLHEVRQERESLKVSVSLDAVRFVRHVGFLIPSQLRGSHNIVILSLLLAEKARITG